MKFNTIADLKGITSAPPSNEEALVLGYWSINDGGGGLFYWDSSSTATPNAGSIIEATALTTGRWIAIFADGIYNIKRFGALGVSSNPLSSKFASLTAAQVVYPAAISLSQEIDGLAVQQIIDLIPQYTSASVYVPKGLYRCTNTILINNRPLHFYGESGSSFSNLVSGFIFPDGVTGLHYKRQGGSTQDAIIERLFFKGENKSVPGANGIFVEARCAIRDVGINGFSQDGIHVLANIGSSGTDASNSEFVRIRTENNGRNGVYIEGADANQCHFRQIDSVDNQDWGIHDASFLGNQFYTCHANSNPSGPYYVQHPTAESGFIDCYSESGTAPSQMNPRCVVVGGLHGADIVSTSPYAVDRITRIHGYTSDGLRFNEQGMYINRNQMGWGDLNLYPNGAVPNVQHHVMQSQGDVNGENSQIWQFWSPGAVVFDRHLQRAGHGFRTLMLRNRRLDFHFDSLYLWEHDTYYEGDTFWNANYNGTNPQGWVCISKGTYLSSPPTGITGTPTYTTEWVMVLNINGGLRPGDIIHYPHNPLAFQAMPINYFHDAPTNLIADVYAQPGGPTAAITVVQPRFKAIGTGAGTTAQRPTTLTADDLGWQYFDTTIAAWITWDGTSWV